MYANLDDAWTVSFIENLTVRFYCSREFWAFFSFSYLAKAQKNLKIFVREKSIKKSLRDEKKVTSRTFLCFLLTKCINSHAQMDHLRILSCMREPATLLLSAFFCYMCVCVCVMMKRIWNLCKIFFLFLFRSYQSLSQERGNFSFLFSLSSLNSDLINELTCRKCSLNRIFERLERGARMKKCGRNL